jgi:hypothetical protein
LYGTIGNGVLDREDQLAAMRNNAIWFGCICVAYVAMSILMRRGDSARPGTNRLQSTAAVRH